MTYILQAWNAGGKNLPVYEPGLEELVASCKDKNLFFTTELESSIQEADVILISVNTPTKKFGAGKVMNNHKKSCYRCCFIH